MLFRSNASCTPVRSTWNVSPYQRCLTPPDWTPGTRLQVYRVDCVVRRCIFSPVEKSAPRRGERSDGMGCVELGGISMWKSASPCPASDSRASPLPPMPPANKNQQSDPPDPDPSLPLPVTTTPNSPVLFHPRCEQSTRIPSLPPRPASGAL